ncbi:MAG TPA: SigB/SigF/SigG family RNA polymerase sigma factor [bacterium]|nr:SigB/SigF/SigG family RNA polymerase sigma factor [bacterium]
MASRRPARPIPTKAEIRALFARYHAGREAEARDELVLAHENLAIYLARKFADRGEPLEDVIQVAQIGLLKAIDRYDPMRGIEFTTYATPTIVGEIKRHFRDKLWAVRVPRRLRELNYALMRAVEELSQKLGRSPTIPEIAEAAGIPFEDVLEAMEVGRAYSPASLDAEMPDGDDDHGTALADTVGTEDPVLESLEDRATLDAALARLPERAREVVRLRFYEDLSQAEIARRLGISQMHVSRVLRDALARLRGMIAGRPPAARD